ncbi:kinase-like protein [Aspergillus costaricaensis CBS 115574]|uniref:Kinase-like protein n=1 Tax=Aspergillus costaricaensis CBS 115574 TaxID=1448317 RepID=A0ACD1INY6_9EURO|nr:kinase-like protein [Aspergillus costaricaensis CBS 115574]RAK92081.1 kinase-like protein [Aspergillus costaricaensis CBS 115574]
MPRVPMLIPTPLPCLYFLWVNVLKGRVGIYKVTQQVSEFVYSAVNQHKKPVVVKSVEGHWRLHNERDVLNHPVEPPAIILKYLDDDVARASRKQRLTRPELKYVAKNVLEALQVLHDDGYVHTDIKPSNILVNYGNGKSRFSDVQLADCGGVVPTDSEYAKDGVHTGTSLFRAPEVHLEIPWGTAADIWSFGVTLINQIWGFNFHIFEPDVPEGHELYDVKILVLHHQWFGPFPISYKEICDQQTQESIVRIMSVIPPEKLKPFRFLREREICDADKAFVLRIMKLDPRDRPTAKDLLQDEWFTEKSERTVGWYSKQE